MMSSGAATPVKFVKGFMSNVSFQE